MNVWQLEAACSTATSTARAVAHTNSKLLTLSLLLLLLSQGLHVAAVDADCGRQFAWHDNLHACRDHATLQPRKSQVYTLPTSSSLTTQATSSNSPYSAKVVLRVVNSQLTPVLTVRGSRRAPSRIHTYGTDEYTYTLKQNDFESSSNNITLKLENSGVGAAIYTLLVSYGAESAKLVQPEVAALVQMQQACCTGQTMPNTWCSRLQTLSRTVQGAESSPDADLCQFPQTVCNAEGHLTRLSITDGSLACPSAEATADLLTAVATLQHLVWLDLSGVHLSGGLNSAMHTLGKLPNLEYLLLANTKVQGELECAHVPAALRVLWLPSNGLRGSVPQCIAARPALLHLQLADNGLYGSIPTDWSSATSLEFLDLSQNFLTGTLPTLPPNLQSFNASSNILNGDLPPLPTPLGLLDCYQAGLSGTVTPTLTQAESLTYLDLGANRLSGSIPDMPPQLAAAYFNENLLSGPVPRLPDSLVGLNLSTNSLSGPIPDANLPAMILLDLSNNQLTGKVPPSLAQAQKLVYLNLSSNLLGGTLGDFASRFRTGTNTLYILDLSHNALTGPVPSLASAALFTPPSSLQPALNLPRILDLSYNSLLGYFPDFLYKAIPSVSLACRCYINIYLDGGNNKIFCPAQPPILDYLSINLLTLNRLSCLDPVQNQQVDLESILTGPSTPPYICSGINCSGSIKDGPKTTVPQPGTGDPTDWFPGNSWKDIIFQVISLGDQPGDELDIDGPDVIKSNHHAWYAAGIFGIALACCTAVVVLALVIHMVVKAHARDTQAQAHARRSRPYRVPEYDAGPSTGLVSVTVSSTPESGSYARWPPGELMVPATRGHAVASTSAGASQSSASDATDGREETAASHAEPAAAAGASGSHHV